MSYKRLVLVLVVAGCNRAPGPAVQGASPASTDTVAEGTVRVVGPQETAQVVLSGVGPDVALIGPLLNELRRLGGSSSSGTIVSGWRGKKPSSSSAHRPISRGGSAPRCSSPVPGMVGGSEEHTSALQSRLHLVCRLLLL